MSERIERTIDVYISNDGFDVDVVRFEDLPYIQVVIDKFLKGDKGDPGSGGVTEVIWDDILNKPDFADVATSGDYDDLSNKPTKLSDFDDDSTHRLVSDEDKSTWNAKQNALESGVTIKTINNESILGSGNIAISGGDVSDKVSGPSSSVDSHIVIFDGTDGKLVKDSGYTILTSVPSGAVFTDTTYENKTASSGGTDVSLVTTGDKYNWDNKGTYSLPEGGITTSDLASGVVVSLGKADTAYQLPSGGIPASDLASGVIPTVPVQDVTVGGTSVVNNGTAVIPAIPDVSGKEDTSNKASTISGNEADTTKYPSTKAVADALGKWGVISQTQTWSGTGTQPRTYVMSDLVRGLIPQANIDLFESAGATFNATTGYFELNGLTDISYEEMKIIYAKPRISLNAPQWAHAFMRVASRTIIPCFLDDSVSVSSMGSGGATSMFYGAKVERLILIFDNFNNSINDSIIISSLTYMLYNCYNLRSVKRLCLSSTINSQTLTNAFSKCYSLEEIELYRLGKDVSFVNSSVLNLASIVYMVDNAINTTAITITLHADALTRCTADTTEYEYNGNTYTGIVALANAKNITLAS